MWPFPLLASVAMVVTNLGLTRHPKLVRGFLVFTVGRFDLFVQLLHPTSRHGGQRLQGNTTFGFGLELDHGQAGDRPTTMSWTFVVRRVCCWCGTAHCNMVVIKGGAGARADDPPVGRCGGEQQE